MKEKAIVILLLIFGLSLDSKAQLVPDTLSCQWFSLFEWRLVDNGLYQKVENIKTKRHIKTMSVISLDKKANEMYVYDEFGCYRVTLTSNWTAYVKRQYNVEKLKPENLKDELLRIENLLESNYKTLNENILAKKAKREEDEKKEREKNANQQRIKREKDLADYRQLHQNWRKIPIRRLNQKCLICHQDYVGDVIRMSGDTLFTIEFLQGYLGYLYTQTHAFHIDNTDKYKLRDYLEAYHDSLSNGLFNMTDAQIINQKEIQDYLATLKKKAPSGFIQRWGWHLNSADGIETYFTYFNTSNKTIKYINFYFTVFNAVGDKCILRYNKSYIGNVKGVGPVEPFELGLWNWDRATHYTSADASEMKIVKLVITYMDGTSKTISQDSIVYDSD